MTCVVTEPCIRCKCTDCVDVCPVDAFREGVDRLVIDPDDCIECAQCAPECPVVAIFADCDVLEPQTNFTEPNARLAPAWLAYWADVFDKRSLLTEMGGGRVR